MANNNLGNSNNVVKPSDYPINEDNYADLAEEVITGLVNRGKVLISSTQIRNLFAFSADIYNRIKFVGGSDKTLEKDLKERLQYFRVRLLYAAGRDDKQNQKDNEKVKAFIEDANLLHYIKLTRTYRDCLLLCRYMEALVAYYSYMAKNKSQNQR